MTNFGNSRTTHFGFLLAPGYSMLPVTAALEPLRLANMLSGEELFRWSVANLGDRPLTASSGMTLATTSDMDGLVEVDILFVCAGLEVNKIPARPLGQWLRRLAGRRTVLGAMCTGTWLLARAELLNGYRCTIHWENMASMREQFPRLIVSSELFEIDRDRYTCAGGTSALDMMLNLIATSHGQQLAGQISEECMCERIRGRNDRQRIPLMHRLGTSQPKLIRAVSLMEANLEEPISLDELAAYTELSRRQLERLFQKYLDCAPTRYYLELRLARARQLLLQTSMSVFDVAFACGFVSAPHFSKCYRDLFGIPPRDERRSRHINSSSSTRPHK